VGNLTTVMLLGIYIYSARPKYSFTMFLIARIVQMVAWILLWLRGTIPGFYSEFIGNSLLFTGWAVEAYTLFTLPRSKLRTEIFFVSVLSISLALNLFLFRLGSSNLKIFFASFVPLLIFIVPGLYLALRRNASLLQRVSGILYLLFSVATTYRAIDALTTHNTYSLMTPNVSQTVAFLSIFWLMMFGSINFLLLSKEKTDKELLSGIRQIATLEERTRLSRDLHDRIAQNLFSLSNFGSSSMKHLIAGENSRAADDLRMIESMTIQTQREMSLLLYELLPHNVGDNTLESLLKERFNNVESRLNLTPILTISGCEKLDYALKQTLFAITIEALNNVIKHASARTVDIQIKYSGVMVHLQIHDDGTGFSTAPASQSQGMGLMKMRQQVEQVGGIFLVASNPGQGTTITAAIPDPKNSKNGDF